MTVQPPDHSSRYADPYEDQPAAYARPSAYRRRRRGRVWLIVIVVLAGLLVAADRVALVITESQLASKIQQSQHLSQKPKVSIDGFPFLTQVVARHFDHATVDIDNLATGGVPIAHIHADLRGVHVSSGYNRATVDTLVGTATLEYTQVSRVMSNDVSNIGQITLKQGTGNQVEASYGLAGIGITADVQVNVLSGNVLEFKSLRTHPPLANPGNGTPANFDVKIPLTGLPFGMRLSSATVTATGVDISATGTNVLLTGNSVGVTG